MPRVTCRCGEKLKVQANGPDRIECPKCGARIRLRRPPAPEDVSDAGDGYIRFHCPCGRRLKVPALARPEVGRCPDCGRIVPVPKPARPSWDPASTKKPHSPDARTDELDADDLAQLERWAARHQAQSSRPGGVVSTAPSTVPPAPGAGVGLFAPSVAPPSTVKFEAGLRVCPRCNKPVHLGATNCRECGTPIPRQ
jgi:hypothetical protein